MPSKIIYTSGITGFIGKNSLPMLLNYYDKVVNFTSKESLKIYTKSKSYETDITTDFFKKNTSNEFLNLATLHLPNPSSAIEMRNLFQANIYFPMKVLGHLDCFENLKIINVLSYTQLLDLPYQNIYSLSKEIFKKFTLLKPSHKNVNLYLFDTFGDNDKRNKVTDVFIRNILSGRPITIPKNEVTINLSHNKAISYSLYKSIALKSGDYCVLSPDSISLEKLANIIMEITGKRVDLIKKKSSVDPISNIKSFPENVFAAPKNYSFKMLLEKRVNEICKNEF